MLSLVQVPPREPVPSGSGQHCAPSRRPPHAIDARGRHGAAPAAAKFVTFLNAGGKL
jgi:hypothetical protein